MGDACHAFDQQAPDGSPVSAAALHLTHLTTLNTEFAQVLDSTAVMALLT